MHTTVKTKPVADTVTNQLKEQAKEAYELGNSHAFYINMRRLEKRLTNNSYVKFCMTLKEL